MANRQQQFLAEYYNQIKGTIVFSGFSEDGYPQFRVVRSDKQVLALELSSDEEGNQPGFIFIGLVSKGTIKAEAEMNTSRNTDG